MTPCSLIALASLGFAAPSAVPNQVDTQILIAQPKVVAISMFKNGYAFVTREIPLTNGEANVVEVPQASLGTLWFWSDKGALDSVTSVDELNEKKVTVPVGSFAQALEQNVGCSVTVDTGNGVLEGKILGAMGEVLILERNGGTTAITKTSIRSVTSSDAKFKWTSESVQAQPRRYYRIKMKGRPASVQMMSLERGVTWSPGYAIDISDPKKLQVIAKATLLNDLTDLENVESRLITGFPNLEFKDILEPLTSRMPLDQWVNTMSPAGPGGLGGAARNRRSEAMTQNAYMPGAAARDADWSGVPQAGGAGQAIGDLFFYDLKGLSLKKGSRVYQTLFRAESEYEHIYCWDIEDLIANNVEYRQIPPGQDKLPEEVWHALKFKNSANQPLTTAPVSILSNGELIGQSQTSYVPTGADAEVRINKSLDIRCEWFEEELSRERGAIKRYDNWPLYDLVRIKGTLEIHNMKADKVKMAVNKEFTGEIQSKSAEATVKKTVKSLREVNPGGTINWILNVDSGKKQTLNYEYTVYVRSQT